MKDDLKWTVVISPKYVDLPPGGSRDVELSICFQGSNGKNEITVTGSVEGEPSISSSCTIECKSLVGAALFLARFTFSSSTEQTLHLSAKEYVKLNSTRLTLGPSSPVGHIRALFDPKSDDTSLRGYILVVSNGGTSESGEVRYHFPLDVLLATNFDMATDSFRFPNWEDQDHPEGYCFGMSETSILYFEDKLTRPGGKKETHDLEKYMVRNVIEDHQNRWLRRFVDWDWWPGTKPVDWYEEVKKGIKDGHPMVLIRDSGGEKHAVVAYKIAAIGDLHYVFVYENEAVYDVNLASGFPYAVYDADANGESFTYDGKVIGIWKARRLPSEWASQLSNSFSNELRVVFQCPVHITITDPYGRAISDTGLDEIPGATVVRDETLTFSLPPGVAYSIDINAYEPGIFSVAIVQPSKAAGDSIRIVVFDCIATLKTTRATIYLPERFSNPVLKIDQDGDGIIDEERFPDFSTHGASVPVSESVNHGPNPVPAEGCIFWLDLPDDTVDVTLKIFDIDGAELVSILLDPTADRYPAAGRWLPEDDLGRLLGTGLYLYLVEIEHTDGIVTCSPVQKMVIQR
ncbi:hypothetical protein KAX17_08985 [Candidatus Bipolaricaulota bacterium]|nr:hypothetical protein [Candidatus Bipolaricaulota bacterium]